MRELGIANLTTRYTLYHAYLFNKNRVSHHYLLFVLNYTQCGAAIAASAFDIVVFRSRRRCRCRCRRLRLRRRMLYFSSARLN